MTKFLTRVIPIALLVLSALPARALPARACSALFAVYDHTLARESAEAAARLRDVGAQTTLIPDAATERGLSSSAFRFQVSTLGAPRVLSALRKIQKNFKLKIERRLDFGTRPETGSPNDNLQFEETEGFTPLGQFAIISVPRRALSDDATLAAYFESLLPIVEDASKSIDRERNQSEVAQFESHSQPLLNKLYENFGVRVFLREIPNLGATNGFQITIDKSFAKKAEAVGTVAHEIYHTTVTRKLVERRGERPSLTHISRALNFSLKTPHVPRAYQDSFRADEYEARARQIAILEKIGRPSSTLEIRKTAEAFRNDQREACEMALTFFDEARVSVVDTPSLVTPRSVRVTLLGDVIEIPLVGGSEPSDPRVYAKQVLERRLEVLRPPFLPMYRGRHARRNLQDD